MPHIHWVKCDGQAHDPDTMVAPLTPKATRKPETLTKVPPNIDSRHEEDAELKKWPKPRLFRRGKKFSKICSGGVWRHRLPQSQTSTCESQCARRFGTGMQSPFQMSSSDTTSTSGWQLPIPMYTYVYVYVYIYIQISYMHIYVYIFTHVNFLTKSKRTRKEKNRRDTDLQVSGHGLRSGVPDKAQVRSGLRSGVPETTQVRSGLGQGVPET